MKWHTITTTAAPFINTWIKYRNTVLSVNNLNFMNYYFKWSNYLLVAKQLSLIRFSRKRIVRTATNIKNKSEIKIDIKRKTKNITLPEQLNNLIDKSHKLRIPLTDIYKTIYFCFPFYLIIRNFNKPLIHVPWQNTNSAIIQVGE
jgi:hypothetical protein